MLKHTRLELWVDGVLADERAELIYERLAHRRKQRIHAGRNFSTTCKLFGAKNRWQAIPIARIVCPQSQHCTMPYSAALPPSSNLGYFGRCKKSGSCPSIHLC